jgi:hypothetical protein
MAAPDHPRTGGLAFAIVAPLAGLAVASVVWWVAEQAGYWPFGRAGQGFGLLAVWWLSPAAAALLWRGLPRATERLAANVIGTLLAVLTVALAWWTLTSGAERCQFGSRVSPETLLPFALMAILLGAGWASSALFASSNVRAGRVWRGAVAGAIALVALTFLLLFAASVPMTMSGVCNRPG